MEAGSHMTFWWTLEAETSHECSASELGRYRVALSSIAARPIMAAVPSPTLGSRISSGVYFPPNATVYLVPLDSIAQFEGRLRLDPPLNNQRRKIRLASEYEIDRWTPEALRSQLHRASAEAEPALNIA